MFVRLYSFVKIGLLYARRDCVMAIVIMVLLMNHFYGAPLKESQDRCVREYGGFADTRVTEEGDCYLRVGTSTWLHENRFEF